MNTLRVISNTQAATKEDLCITLAYFQDALDIAEKLRVKIDRMPVLIRSMLEDKGQDLEVGTRAEFIILQSIKYLDDLIECFEQPLF